MLKATWLGDWKAPWGLERGRRWGDSAWALAAVAQAWLLGGRTGQWPHLDVAARRPRGPYLQAAPTVFSAQPDPDWVALLRHGSAEAPPTRRGPRESEAMAWAWEALLDGDGAPWMALGSVLLDLPQRLRWISLLGAVDPGGTLHLPPFLAVLPEVLHTLPPGWWETLLRAQDTEGRLLPEGVWDPALPWPLLQRHAERLVLPQLPADLAPFQGEPWLQELPGQGWLLDPRLRAWGRGFGAAPPGLAPLVPDVLGVGAPPDRNLGAVLALTLPTQPPPGWAPALAADLTEQLTRPALPTPAGHPTWDRLRMRWGGEAAPLSPGYPSWDTVPHACADPFHWMAQGQRSALACAPEPALRAFTLAHAHFLRLGAPGWAARAASNAALMALQWADLPAHGRWAQLRGPLPPPWCDLETAQLAEVFEEPATSLPRLQDLVGKHPDLPQAWGLLASHAADHGRWELVATCLPHVADHPYAQFLKAALGPLVEGPPEDADPETRTSWEAHRLFRGLRDSAAFWEAWAACPNQVLRLEQGLQVLERVPGQVTAERLLAHQVIADRARSTRHQRRLAALWPPVPQEAILPPVLLFKDWLAQRSSPTWIAWTEEGQVRTLGAGTPPPEGALARLVLDEGLAPFQHGDWVWRGYPLVWEGCAVGSVLMAHAAGTAPVQPLEPLLMAPWLARLRARRPSPTPALEAGRFFTDGSEPVAGVLRELDRVATSDLPVLVLGDTGTGKELLAEELHRRSGRAGRLVAVNCSAFAEGLLESELFGHTKGAFTGADRERRGAIEGASGGTLFLDEVADLSPRLQSLLLRVLQEREIRRVGSDHAITVDVRFAAATHRDMEALAASGAFRRDLLFRLQGATLQLPTLAQRRHEFPFLLPRLTLRAAEAVRRPVPALAPGLDLALARLPWPGNVRELLHVLERAILRCEDGLLRPAHFPELATPVLQSHTWEEATRNFQRQFLLEALRTHGYRAADTAEALGLARPALYATARRLGVDLRAERLKTPD